MTAPRVSSLGASLTCIIALAAACLSPSASISDEGAGGRGEGEGGSGGTTGLGSERSTEGSGGAQETGGAIGSGGAQASGGVMGSGGQSTAGGALATGGRVGRSGGATGLGGRTTTGTGGSTTAGGAAGGGETTATGGSTGAGNTSSTGVIKLAGNQILDCGGQPIVARGPENVVAEVGQTKDIDQAAAMGANAIRMLFTLDEVNAMTPAGFDKLLAQAAARRMLVWVSLYTWDVSHDHVIGSALGGGNFYSLKAPVGTPCSAATPSSCYLAVWSRSWLKDLMAKYRCNVIVDASQEFINPGDPGTAAARAAWAAEAKTNIEFFRAQGYTNPLQIMSNFEGRDLYAIVEHGPAIRAADTVLVDGEPQTMFGWQAYWGTSDNYFPEYQGELLLGRSGKLLSGAEAIHQFAATQPFPIEVGIDNYAADTNLDYQAEIDQAAADKMSWLWWSWRNGGIECPVSGSTCVQYVTTSENGFKGAKPLSQ